MLSRFSKIAFIFIFLLALLGGKTAFAQDDILDQIEAELQAEEEKKKAAEKKFSDAIKNIKDQFKTVEKFLKIIKPLNYREAIGAVKTFAKP